MKDVPRMSKILVQKRGLKRGMNWATTKEK